MSILETRINLLESKVTNLRRQLANQPCKDYEDPSTLRQKGILHIQDDTTDSNLVLLELLVYVTLGCL